jgi:hypothetical protein
MDCVSFQVAHNHHVVPQVFLKGFAAGAHLCEHHRNGSTSKVTVKKAAVVPDFYLTTSGTTTDDALEEWLGKSVESPAADIVKALRKGQIPERTARATAATFVAFQMVRGPALRRRLHEIGEHLGPLLFGVKVTGQVLKKTPGWKPGNETLQGMVARAAEQAPDDIGQAGVEADLRTMVREAERLRGLLVDMHWSVCTSTADLLVVGDTPAVALDLVDGLDAGILTLPDRFEVVMPLSPRRLLVVSPYPALGSGAGILTAELAAKVNAAAVRNCETSVFHHPNMSFPADLVLPPNPPAVPTPQVHMSHSDGGKTPMAWPELAEQQFKDAIDLLGGDPDLN